MPARLLLLTDRSQLPAGRSLVSVVADCVDAGLTDVLLRELDETEPARTALVAALTQAGATVISAHGPLPGARGVHLPATAGCDAVSEALLAGHDQREASLTARYTVGVSCHSAAEVAQAATVGAHYATLSPFAATASKPGYAPLDPREYAAAREAGIPVYALGGITPENAAAAIGAGADGLAVMGAVMRAVDPAAVVRELLEIVEEAPW